MALFLKTFFWVGSRSCGPSLASLSIGLLCVLSASAVDYQVYVGTYTDGSSEGIYSFEFDDRTGKAGPVRLVARTVNPSFIALHGNGRFLYAVNEVNQFDGQPSGAVSAYKIGENGGLSLINQLATGGAAPCHLVVDGTGKNLLVANYNGGNISVFRLAQDGSLEKRTELLQHLGSSVSRQRQTAPHAHSINLDLNNRFAAAADLGVDKVFLYPLNTDSGRLNLATANSVSLPLGSGPRHFAFHPNGTLAFVNNEMLSSLTSLRYDPKWGRLSLLDTESTLPGDFSGRNSTAETQIHPNGEFVYVSNRGHDSIAIFRVDQKNGDLDLITNESTRGRTPRNFGLDPQGKFLFAANQGSDTVVLFKVNAINGLLSATGLSLKVPAPVCVKFKRL
jgi:6-phosphogluconolactonase